MLALHVLSSPAKPLQQLALRSLTCHVMSCHVIDSDAGQVECGHVMSCSGEQVSDAALLTLGQIQCYCSVVEYTE